MTAVTVGISSKDEEATIVDAIHSAATQQGVEELEILVVAAGSDRTIPLAHECAGSDQRVRVLVDSDPQGKLRAVNRILREARGRIVALSDGDVTLEPGALTALLAPFEQTDVGGTTGRPVPTAGNATFMDFVANTSYELFHRIRLNEMVRTGTVTLASGYLLAVRRELLSQLPEGSGVADDAMISSIIRRQGYRIAYCPEARVRVHFPSTVKDFLIQKRRNRRMQLNGHASGSLDDPRTIWWELERALIDGEGLSGLSAKEWLFGAGFAGLTALSWTLAYWDRLFGRSGNDIWRAAPSTKRAFGPREP